MENRFQQLTEGKVLETYPKEVQSKVVLGASKLSEEDYATARSLFEQSIALDHQCGVAWIGKAYAEASLNFVDGHNYIPTIDHSLQFARKSLEEGSFFQNQQANVLETLIRRITDELLTKLEIVRKSQIQAEKARNEAAISALIAVAGATVGSSSESRTGKVLGYGTAAVAGANTVAALSNAAEFSGLAGSVFGLLLAQCYLSAPVLNQANQFKDHLPEGPRSSMLQAISRWRAAAADCYNLQLSRLTTTLADLRTRVSGSDALKASGDLDEGFQANYAEVSALKMSAQMFGLNKHSSYARLDRFLGELESTLQSEKAKRDFKMAKQRRIIAISATLGVAVLSSVGVMCIANGDNPHSDENKVLGGVFVWLDLIGFIVAFVFYRWKGLFKAETQKKLGALTKEFAECVRDVKVSEEDIVLSRIKGDAEAVYSGFTTPSP